MYYSIGTTSVSCTSRRRPIWKSWQNSFWPKASPWKYAISAWAIPCICLNIWQERMPSFQTFWYLPTWRCLRINGFFIGFPTLSCLWPGGCRCAPVQPWMPYGVMRHYCLSSLFPWYIIPEIRKAAISSPYFPKPD